MLIQLLYATYLAERQSTSFGEAVKADLLPVKYVSSGELDWDSNVDGLPDGVSNDYTIYAISEGKLYFGDLSSGDGSTPEDRPTTMHIALKPNAVRRYIGNLNLRSGPAKLC